MGQLVKIVTMKDDLQTAGRSVIDHLHPDRHSETLLSHDQQLHHRHVTLRSHPDETLLVIVAPRLRLLRYHRVVVIGVKDRWDIESTLCRESSGRK